MNYNNLSLDTALSREFSKMGVTVKGLKNLWLNGSLWKQKWLFYGIAVKTLLSTFIFKSEADWTSTWIENVALWWSDSTKGDSAT